MSKALSQLLVTHRLQSLEIHEVRALYRKEALQRKLLYNEVHAYILTLYVIISYALAIIIVAVV